MAYLRNDNPYNPGYALPQNVIDEPYGRGVIVTKYLRRKTISALEPAQLRGGRGLVEVGPVKHSLTGTIFDSQDGLGSLGCDNGKGSLGCAGGQGSLSGATVGAPSADDPIGGFGSKAARHIMSKVKTLPANQRVPALRTILNKIDSTLWTVVAGKAAQLQKQKGYAPAVAVERALAASLANRLAAGVTKRPFGRAKSTSLTGLGIAEGVAAGQAPIIGAPNPLSMSTTSYSVPYTTTLDPDHDHRTEVQELVRKWQYMKNLNIGSAVGSNISRGISPFSTFKNTNPLVLINVGLFKNKGGVKPTWGRYFDGKTFTIKPAPEDSLIGDIVSPLATVASATGKVINTVTDLACAALNNPNINKAASGAATAQGGPAGAISVKAASSMCSRGQSPLVTPPGEQGGVPWVPIAVGAGVLGALYFLVR